MYVQIFRGNDGWYFRVRAKNGEIVAQSEGYTTHAKCLKTANLIRKWHLLSWPVQVTGVSC